MTYLEGDSWTYHKPVWTDCGECEEEFDNQEDEGNICPACKEKEGENMTCNNCTYEIDGASEQGFCDNCERAYQLGRESK